MAPRKRKVSAESSNAQDPPANKKTKKGKKDITSADVTTMQVAKDLRSKAASNNPSGVLAILPDTAIDSTQQIAGYLHFDTTSQLHTALADEG